MEELNMKGMALSQEDECWSIAESIVEEVELMKSKEIGRSSTGDKLKGSFKDLLMRGLRR